MKYAVPIFAACLLIGCAGEPDPEVRSEVFHLSVTSTALYAAGVLTIDEQQGFEFVAPSEPGYIRVGVEMIGDLGFYSNDGDEQTAVADSDGVDESTNEEKGCVYVTPDEVVFVELRGFALISEYLLSIVFKGIGTTP